jgi:hypothetical protein
VSEQQRFVMGGPVVPAEQQIAKVLAAHILANSWCGINGPRNAACSCGASIAPWTVGGSHILEDSLHRAHLAAVLNEEVVYGLQSAAWVQGEQAGRCNEMCDPDHEWPCICVANPFAKEDE